VAASQLTLTAEARKAEALGLNGGEVRINRSTYRVKPFCLSSETVLPIERNRSTYRAKPFYPSSELVRNRSTHQVKPFSLSNGAFPATGICPCKSGKKYKACCDPKKNLKRSLV
jgi:hypothetical protein